jgi:hypothetical protein
MDCNREEHAEGGARERVGDECMEKNKEEFVKIGGGEPGTDMSDLGGKRAAIGTHACCANTFSAASGNIHVPEAVSLVVSRNCRNADAGLC